MGDQASQQQLEPSQTVVMVNKIFEGSRAEPVILQLCTAGWRGIEQWDKPIIVARDNIMVLFDASFSGVPH